jgi:serine/threonine-protein kinase
MAIVHLGRLLGEVGFSRTVAIKRVHPNLVHDPDFVAMFVDEARLAARIHHPNVVPTLDVVTADGEMLLVMEYVHGESLASLIRRSQTSGLIPLPVCSAILTGILHGLHAAHEAKDEQGEPLGIVHRDVSPQNLMVGADGVPRILDFGVAKASNRMQTTREGTLKGKLAYMAPEQLASLPVTRRSDIYAASVVAWELLTGKRLFVEPNEGAMIRRILEGAIRPPSAENPSVPPEVDAIILQGLSREPADRFATARQMALTLETSAPPALATEVARMVEELAGDMLRQRSGLIAAMESSQDITPPGPNPIEGSLSPDEGGLSARSGDDETRSQLSVRSDGAPASSRRRGLLLAAAIAMISVLVAVLLWPARPAGPSVAATSASSAPAVPTSIAPNGAESAARATSLDATDADAAASSVSSSPKPSAPSRGARPAGKVKSANCDPPYTVDSIGRKIYKRECY